MRPINREQSPAEVDFATSMDDSIALSLWYATVYVVIQGWRNAGISDSEIDELLGDDRVDDLSRFRNQIFHYQREYDSPRLLGFLKPGMRMPRRQPPGSGTYTRRWVEPSSGHCRTSSIPSERRDSLQHRA